MYDFNRADSLIMLDLNNDFNGNKQNSNKEKRKEIIDCIAIAVSRKKLRRIVSKNASFQKWIKLNSVTQLELDKELEPELDKDKAGSNGFS
ncbi:hypothetical protein [Crocosphaera sp. Alani8]|uniref:hypothetical protein n=1 Tax=Crocosphaera sp. Alani8 TaxID=3038952 RepID=UPI00313C45DC